MLLLWFGAAVIFALAWIIALTPRRRDGGN